MIDSGWLFGVETLSNLKMKTLLWLFWLEYAAELLWLGMLGSEVEHLPLIIGKLMEWFSGRKEVVCS